MLSRLEMRRIASPNRPATEMTSTFAGQASGCVSTRVGHEQALDRAVVEALDWRSPVSSPWVTTA